MSATSDPFGDLERELVAAARRRAPAAASARPRRLRVARRGLLAAGAALVAAGAALAATQPWHPQLGDEHRGHPTASESPPPREQLATFGVLRRPQTDADRGAHSRYSLRFLTARGVAGVRTPYVRLLHVDPNGLGFVLIPVERAGSLRDALCVFSQDVDGGGFGCFTTAQIEAGRDIEGLGRRVYSLVPDGVARVRLSFAGGVERTATVHDNFFVVTAPPEPTGLPEAPGLFPEEIAWLGSDGQVVKRIDLRPKGPPPKIPPLRTSDTPPPASQLARYAVLRRPRTAADRGPVVRHVLLSLRGGHRVVRRRYVRFLAGDPDRAGWVLVPVARYRPSRLHGAPAGVRRDGLCLAHYNVHRRELTSPACGEHPRFGAEAGVVPDGVRRVVVRFEDGSVRRARVHHNLFDLHGRLPNSPATSVHLIR